MRGAAGSTTQYHPYLQMDSRNVCSDQQVSINRSPNNHQTRAQDGAATEAAYSHNSCRHSSYTNVTDAHPDATDVYDRSAMPPRHSSERDSTECDAPTSGPATSGTLVAGLWTISRCCVLWLDLGGMVMQRCSSQLSASQPRLL